jgi:hypothetical protein
MDWDRSHDWILLRRFHDRAMISVAFERGQPSVGELIALRKCLPQFRDMSPAALRDSAGSSGRLDLGEFDGILVRPLVEKLEREGLAVAVRKTSFISYLPLDRTTNSAMIVEDAGEAKELAERMIEAGIPIQDIVE